MIVSSPQAGSGRGSLAWTYSGHSSPGAGFGLLHCPIIQKSPVLLIPTDPLPGLQVPFSVDQHTAACLIFHRHPGCPWKWLAFLPFTSDFEKIAPLAFSVVEKFSTTEVATRALHWARPSEVCVIQKLDIPICGLSRTFTFFLSAFATYVRKLYCSVTSPSVS